jgi:hypothetical protein
MNWFSKTKKNFSGTKSFDGRRCRRPPRYITGFASCVHNEGIFVQKHFCPMAFLLVGRTWPRNFGRVVCRLDRFYKEEKNCFQNALGYYLCCEFFWQDPASEFRPCQTASEAGLAGGPRRERDVLLCTETARKNGFCWIC